MTHGPKPSIDSEMHELNAEADLLEQKTTVVPGGANGEDTKLQSHSADSDAQAMVIESLRTQVQELFSQVSQLNNKLVRSYDRVSDLEDELYVTSSNLRQATLKVSQLELEHTQHLSALSTGLLVEKSNVTLELTRLMEKATEEAARRGQAESARAEIEKDLDDLSAGLFHQANTMVAEARIAEARSARKLVETEAALRSAEEIVGVLQSQMQSLQSERETADRRMEEMRIRMGKGKWVDRSPETARATRPRLLASHLPYHEFIIFVSHLRAIRPASSHPPAMSTLLPLPFLARLVAEDSDPTVRLDLAPSLNWLSRRSVLAAIHSGQLTVEPMQFTTLLEELAPPNIPASSHHTHIVCALCGMPIYSTHSDSPGSTPTTPNPRFGSQSASWSTTLFKTVRAGEINIPTPFTGHNRHSAQIGPTTTEPPSHLYIFRLEATSSGLPVSLPISSQQPSTPARPSIYPLCTNGWCLGRLRTTCSLWAFVRTSIVEKIWEEPPFTTQVNGITKPGVNGVEQKHDGPNGTVGDRKPPTTIQPPPRRTKIGLGSLWGTMQRSLSGAREPEKDAGKAKELEKEDTRPKLPPRDPSRTKGLPLPPPSHPSVSHAPKSSVSSVHRVPPPFKDTASAAVPAPVVAPTPTIAPPPLPKRNRGRDASVTPEPGSKTSGAPNGDVTASNEPAPTEVKAPPPSADPTELSQLTSNSSTDPPAADNSTAATEPAWKVESTSPKPELTVPTSISRATSNDSFSTPTEELNPDLDSTPAATTIPLPASQEPSPTAEEQTSSTGTTPPTEPVAAAPEAPAAASPEVATPVLPAAAVVNDEKPPSRTGSPAPPPLPRRAAARQRPSSALVSQTMEQPKRDSVDAAPATEAPTVQPAPAPAAAEEPVRVVTEEPQSIDDVAASTPHPEPNSDAEVPEVPPAAEEYPHPESQPESTLPTAEPHVNGDAKAAELDSAPDAPATDAVAVVNGEIAKGDAVTASESVETAEAAEEQDSGQYVGDATWEERTYKELMRLREEMFWARIGAVAH
ncbi:hypothetical protein C8Q80DRAFT_1226504 [Daedaleopsis nitida]|nr:hypothetical protein C8Q80DRAFT_1226504 [Daedaleopsis nitida]